MLLLRRCRSCDGGTAAEEGRSLATVLLGQPMSNLNLYATLALPLLVRVQDPHRNLGRRWCATPEIRLCVVDGSDSGPLAFPAVHRGDEKVVQDQDPKLRRSALASLCSPALLLGGPSLPAAALHIVTNAAEPICRNLFLTIPRGVVESERPVEVPREELLQAAHFFDVLGLAPVGSQHHAQPPGAGASASVGGVRRHRRRRDDGSEPCDEGV
mmetsp:Transcript_105872/g.273989  ORF Transcript_105872/g.273989 Transcript_105872/m.273989 type:complete len:213 (+) Transcript_105872:490-1128(+)